MFSFVIMFYLFLFSLPKWTEGREVSQVVLTAEVSFKTAERKGNVENRITNPE